MKKVFLLLTIGSFAFAATAQENKGSVLFTNGNMEEAGQNLQLSPGRVQQVLNYTRSANSNGNVAHKTTTPATDRWYNYGDYYDTSLIDGGTGVGISGVLLWKDTLGEAVYTSGLAHNRQVSVGSVFMPQAAGFNDINYYYGKMKIDATKAYTVDSIRIYGSHNLAAAKLGVVDTIIITAGVGANIHSIYYTGMATRYGSDTVRCANLRYDSVANTEAMGLGSPVTTMKYPILPSHFGDTLSDGTFFMSLQLPVVLSAAAGELTGMSLSFKSGDATFPTTLPGDTIDAFTGVYKYNSFYPYSIFKQVGTTVSFAPYNAADLNEGLFKTLPSFSNGYATQYVPMWAWSTSGGTAGSYLQHIYMDWHARCSNCDNVGVNEVTSNIISTRAFPNPAEEVLNITCSMVNNATATVSLTNTMGQVVASQSVANGRAVFNTTALPAGVYLYTVTANGEQSTGRVVIAH